MVQLWRIILCYPQYEVQAFVAIIAPRSAPDTLYSQYAMNHLLITAQSPFRRSSHRHRTAASDISTPHPAPLILRAFSLTFPKNLPINLRPTLSKAQLMIQAPPARFRFRVTPPFPCSLFFLPLHLQSNQGIRRSLTVGPSNVGFYWAWLEFGRLTDWWAGLDTVL